jgi:hypothetical protein
MNMHTRQKLSLAMALVAVPVMVIMWIDAARKMSRRRDPPPPDSAPAAPAAFLPQTPEPPASPTTAGTNTASEKRIKLKRALSAGQPRRNPFAPTSATTSTVVSAVTGELRLSAIMKATDPNNRMAMINGAIRRQGDIVAGWKIMQIRNDSVLLFNGITNIVLNTK